MNLMMLLEMAADGLGDRVAVGSLDDGLTYRQLFEQAGEAAARFRADPGEKVVLCDESSPRCRLRSLARRGRACPTCPSTTDFRR